MYTESAPLWRSNPLGNISNMDRKTASNSQTTEEIVKTARQMLAKYSGGVQRAEHESPKPEKILPTVAHWQQQALRYQCRVTELESQLKFAQLKLEQGIQTHASETQQLTDRLHELQHQQQAKDTQLEYLATKLQQLHLRNEESSANPVNNAPNSCDLLHEVQRQSVKCAALESKAAQLAEQLEQSQAELAQLKQSRNENIMSETLAVSELTEHVTRLTAQLREKSSSLQEEQYWLKTEREAKETLREQFSRRLAEKEKELKEWQEKYSALCSSPGLAKDLQEQHRRTTEALHEELAECLSEVLRLKQLSHSSLYSDEQPNMSLLLGNSETPEEMLNRVMKMSNLQAARHLKGEILSLKELLTSQAAHAVCTSCPVQ
eukprot:TRINITY_DN7786_c0_g1_i1.p1 TRINITY_DN7786_c0_g1~~TRINITY_DN7786_c0_g1_i1.p1  ORF type:complete len:377 (+),score=81.12 TRINITY_DN7786_c0_g1_i1:29-1159(+)